MSRVRVKNREIRLRNVKVMHAPHRRRRSSCRHRGPEPAFSLGRATLEGRVLYLLLRGGGIGRETLCRFENRYCKIFFSFNFNRNHSLDR